MTITFLKLEHAEMMRAEIARVQHRADLHRKGECADEECEFSSLLNELSEPLVNILLDQTERSMGLGVMRLDNIDVSNVNGNTVSNDEEAHHVLRFATSIHIGAGEQLTDCTCFETECDHYRHMIETCGLVAAARQAALKWNVFNSQLN